MSTRLLSTVCDALLVAAALVHPAAQPADTPWPGTWSVSPQGGGVSFKQQPPRQVVHTSIGGTSARVEVSNAFGSGTDDNRRWPNDLAVRLATDGSRVFPDLLGHRLWQRDCRSAL